MNADLQDLMKNRNESKKLWPAGLTRLPGKIF